MWNINRFGYNNVYLSFLAQSDGIVTISIVLMVFSFVLEGLGATLNVARPKQGQSVAIFGLGAVGLAVSCLVASNSSSQDLWHE